MMTRKPEDTPAVSGITVKSQLAAMEIATSSAMKRFFFEAGMITARNIPYRATDRASVTREGRILPIRTPETVPAVHPAAAMIAAP